MHYITKEKAKTRRNPDKFPLCKINIFLFLFRVIQKLFINKNLTMPYRHTEGRFQQLCLLQSLQFANSPRSLRSTRSVNLSSSELFDICASAAYAKACC